MKSRRLRKGKNRRRLRIKKSLKLRKYMVSKQTKTR